MSASRPIAIVTALLLVASAAAVPGTVSATSHLNTTVEQDASGAVTVTVNSSEGLVSGATVNVTPADPANDSYAGSGEYTTDENGTVSLPAPASEVDVVVNATADGETVSSTVLLRAPTLDVDLAQDPETANATVSVTYAITGEGTPGATVAVSATDANDSYAGEGSYTADANGTVALPAPAEPVEVEIEATSDDLAGNLTSTLQNASTLAEDEEDAENFGARVSAFVHELFGADVRVPWIGRTVAEFVVANNPGNAPEHAGPKAGTGPPDHAGPDGDDADDARSAAPDADDDEHPSADRGPDGDRGPPETADRQDGDADEEERPEAEEDEGDDEDDDGPSARGGGNGGASNAGGNGEARGHGK